MAFKEVRRDNTSLPAGWSGAARRLRTLNGSLRSDQFRFVPCSRSRSGPAPTSRRGLVGGCDGVGDCSIMDLAMVGNERIGFQITYLAAAQGQIVRIEAKFNLLPPDFERRILFAVRGLLEALPALKIKLNFGGIA